MPPLGPKASCLVRMLLILCFITVLQGETHAAPMTDEMGPISNGFSAYDFKGPGSAVGEWVKGGPLEGTEAARERINSLEEIQNTYGSFKGYEIIAIGNPTQDSRVVFVEIKFDKGPQYGRFLLYLPKDKWIVSNISRFEPTPEGMLPEFLLFPNKRILTR